MRAYGKVLSRLAGRRKRPGVEAVLQTRGVYARFFISGLQPCSCWHSLDRDARDGGPLQAASQHRRSLQARHRALRNPQNARRTCRKHLRADRQGATERPWFPLRPGTSKKETLRGTGSRSMDGALRTAKSTTCTNSRRRTARCRSTRWCG